MNWIDVEGATPDEALRKILSKVGAKAEEVKYEVLPSPGPPGSPARIRVWVEPREVKEARDLIREFLEKLGTTARVDFLLLGKKHYKVNIRTRSYDSVLIGKRGETLRALEYLVNLMLRRRKLRVQLDIDVSGYRERQMKMAINKALAIAVRVKETGQEMTMDPLSPGKRRRVRDILRQDPDIRVYTAGRGGDIYLVIAPKKQAE